MSDETATTETPDDYRPTGTELVIADLADAESVFEILDRHDEDQVLALLQGQAVDEWFYKFPQDGQMVVDLSIKGVFDTVTALNRTGKCRMRLIPGSLEGATVDEDGETFYEATVWAEDQATGFSASGHSYEPKRKKLKKTTAEKKRQRGEAVGEDDTVWNPFAKTIAVNKAERNALAKFIPQRIRLTLIAQFMRDPSRIREIKAGPGAEAAAELPAPLDDEKALAQKQEARDLYTEIREVAPGGLAVGVPPARFHAYLTRAEHSHERLEDFLGFLRDKLAEAKGGAA